MYRDYWAGRGAHPRGDGELLISPPIAGKVPARSVLVYLPPGYRDGRDRFPLLLLHDGQNLFDEATSFAGSWRAQKAFDHLARTGRPVIGVGIPNAGWRRIQEYAPVRDKRYGGGGGEDYGCYLVDAILPELRRQFRVRRDDEGVGTAGASMGGLISLHAFFAYPEIFGLAGAMSPSLFFGREALTRWIGRRAFTGGRIYLDIGTLEGRRFKKGRSLPKFPSGAMRRLRKLRKILEKKGYERGRNLEWIEEPGGRHDEAAWSRRLPGMLEFLFPPESRGIG
jgi:predicted alpha/beta superfamily hydrolase